MSDTTLILFQTILLHPVLSSMTNRQWVPLNFLSSKDSLHHQQTVGSNAISAKVSSLTGTLHTITNSMWGICDLSQPARESHITHYILFNDQQRVSNVLSPFRSLAHHHPTTIRQWVILYIMSLFISLMWHPSHQQYVSSTTLFFYVLDIFYDKQAVSYTVLHFHLSDNLLLLM